jgi:hypothetical protein
MPAVPNTEASLEYLSSFLFFITGRHLKGKLGLGWSLAKVAVCAGAGNIHMVNRSCSHYEHFIYFDLS